MRTHGRALVRAHGLHTIIRLETIRQDGKGFLVFTGDGRTLRASGIVAASGSF